MKPLNILITGGGSPGIAGTIYSLRNNYDRRKNKIITVDARSDVVGKYLADGFYTIPKATDTEIYLTSLKKICKEESIDVLLPQNTVELLHLAKNKADFLQFGTKIIVSEYSNMIVANNKFKLLEICEKIGIPFPKYYLASSSDELKKAAVLLGYPENIIVVKPPDSNGSRGIRIIDEKKDYKEAFYNDKPTNLFIKMNQLLDILGENFEPLLVMEYLEGDEVTLDVFRDQQNFVSIPRKRDEIKSGISFQNSAFRDNKLIEYSKIISDYLELKYCFGFQFKYDRNRIPKILECNPRVQGTMIFSTFMGANIIYSAIKSAMGENIPEFNLNWSTKLIRYWGALGIINENYIRV